MVGLVAPTAGLPARLARAYRLSAAGDRGRGVLDGEKGRPPDERAPQRPPPTKAALWAAGIATIIRRNHARLRRLGLAISLIIVSTSLFIFVRTIVRVDPRQLEAAFAATGLDQ